MSAPLLNYDVAGTGKRSLVLVHGFGLNRKTWLDVAPRLAKESTLYMVDLVGCGKSPAPEKWPYTIEAQADALFQFLKKKNLSDITMIGHSYGGSVALLLLHKLTQLNALNLVTKLVLIAPAAYRQGLPFFIMLPRIPLIGPILLKRLNAEFQIKTTLKTVCRNKNAVTEERVKRYAGNLSNTASRRALIKTAKNVFTPQIDMLSYEINTLQTPALLVYGEHDSVIPEKNLKRLANSLPHVVTHILKDCGHMPQEEFPEVTAEIISAYLSA